MKKDDKIIIKCANNETLLHISYRDDDHIEYIRTALPELIISHEPYLYINESTFMLGYAVNQNDLQDIIKQCNILSSICMGLKEGIKISMTLREDQVKEISAQNVDKDVFNYVYILSCLDILLSCGMPIDVLNSNSNNYKFLKIIKKYFETEESNQFKSHFIEYF